MHAQDLMTVVRLPRTSFCVLLDMFVRAIWPNVEKESAKEFSQNEKFDHSSLLWLWISNFELTLKKIAVFGVGPD